METESKPLPPLPPTSPTGAPTSSSHVRRTSATLTVDSRRHLRRFLEYALTEEGEGQTPLVVESDHGTESWVDALEAALNALSERIAMGGWLAGVRRARKAKREREERQRQEFVEVEREDGEEEEETPSTVAAQATTTRDAETVQRIAIQQLDEVISRAVQPIPKPTSKHLLLTVSPYSEAQKSALLCEDEGFDIVPSTIGCRFTASTFHLPKLVHDEQDPGIVLFGLQEWDVDTPEEARPRIVGGTFTFRGVSSSSQHSSLVRILRLATYMQLSLLLEQSFLRDSHVELTFPKPPTPPIIAAPAPAPVQPTPPPPSPISPPASERGSKHRQRDSGIWSFLNKKTEDLRNKAASVTPTFARRSMDIPRNLVSPASSSSTPHSPSHSPSQLLSPLPSQPSPRTRTFSFLEHTAALSPLALARSVSRREPPDAAPPQPQDPPDDPRPFSAALEGVKNWQDLLSTSPGVVFQPPPLLVALAEKERTNPNRRLQGDEKVAIHCILGWKDRETRGKDMAGISGFLRHQSFSALFSTHVPSSTSKPSASGSELSHSTAGSVISSSASSTHSASDTASVKQQQQQRTYALCSGRRKWVSYHYYARLSTEGEQDGEPSLGETIADMCSRTNEICENDGCNFARGEHELRWIHAGVRVTARFDAVESPGDVQENEETMYAWLGCMMCDARTEPKKVGDGTFLLSYGKFLELLVYSPAICTISPSLCEHTSAPEPSLSISRTPLLPSSRLNITRHFSFHGHTISFALTSIEDIFELRVPRLQIVRGALDKAHVDRATEIDKEKEDVQKEIEAWWNGLKAHMDKLQDQIEENKAEYYKTLPRLPPAELFEIDVEEEGSKTPKASALSLDPGSLTAEGQSMEALNDIASEPSVDKPLPERPLPSVSLDLLRSLRRNFTEAEQSLYDQLRESPISALNDVRRSFQSAARGASKRLAVWQDKHFRDEHSRGAGLKKLVVEEPWWWKKGCHAVPGGKVIIRESDWGSIIAFTLSSQDYLRELTNMKLSRNSVAGVGVHSAPSTPTPGTSYSSRRSYFPTSPLKLFRPSAPVPDPDDDTIVWHEPEMCSAVIGRKEHPRDPTSILALNVRKRAADGSTSSGSGFQSGGATSGGSSMLSRARVGSANGSVPMPPSAWAKPAVELSLQAAGGNLIGLPADSGGAAGKILHEIEAAPPSDHTKSATSLFGSSYGGSSFFEAHLRRGGATSIVSSDDTSGDQAELKSKSDHGSDDGRASEITVRLVPPPSIADLQKRRGSGAGSLGHAETEPQDSDTGSTGGYGTLTTQIANAMKLVLGTGGASQSLPPPSKNHHALLSAEFSVIDERPHIKYDWTIGKRLKFSCTVYYAKQFDALRRRCGADDVFLKSLEKSANWAAEGGKSKSNFWKTSDDRFIIKTLVNAWNVADLQVLIDLGPGYFRYMEHTASHATVLAKLLGFYTIEVRNLETGTTQSRADLLVMENLFYDQSVVKTFDLKGIQGRKVKAKSDGNKTLFDGDWMEGQERALTLVHPHSKVVFREAIKSDCTFLAESNIMDYSVLLGIDEEKKQIACGLVDTIGSYTFAKTLEYKAKQGLAAGTDKQVTVVPPQEYQERFVTAMDNYFLAAPDKWSKPMDGTKEIGDVWMLPSVL